MSETSKTLRAIAHNYIKAAEHLEAAEWLAASVESSPHAAAAKTLADVEPMEPSGVDEYDDAAIGDAGPMVVDAAVWREPVEPTGERHPNIGAALDRCRDVLGWDPDTLSSVDACSAIAELMSLDELDCAEALEKRRVEMSPRRSSRSTVLTAIAKRRSELEAAGVQS